MIELNKIKEILKGEVNPNVDVDKMKIDDSWNSVGVDSLDRSSIFLAVEENFDIEISDEEIEEIDSIESLIKLIERKK